MLGTGDKGRFDLAADLPGLNFDNPIRRDVAMLQPGWLVVAFKTDNPGAWVMHCHIAWHVSQGLSVQFLEVPDKIPGFFNLGRMEEACEAWRAYDRVAEYHQNDSGL